MVVDDNPVVRAAVHAFLGGQDEGRVVAEAGDGREAVHLVRRHRPDVTLLAAAKFGKILTTTSGTGGSCRPPMNHSGISTPQSIGATDDATSLAPKLTPTAGTPADISASSTNHDSSPEEGTSSATDGGAPDSWPDTRLDTSTPMALPMCTL